MDQKKKQKQKFPRTLGLTITNSITLVRFLGILPILTAYKTGDFIKTGVLAGIVGITDKLDGISARYLNGYSKFGALFDASTDKIFAIILNILLLNISPLFLLNLIGECEIGILNLYYMFKKDYCNKSSKIGKIKTVTLFTEYVLSFLLVNSSLQFLIPIFILGNFTFQQAVLMDYYKTANNHFNIKEPITEKEIKEKEETTHQITINKQQEKVKSLIEKKEILYACKSILESTYETEYFNVKIKKKTN